MMNSHQVYFKNRQEAAVELLDILPIDSMKLEEWIVIASSYGGYEIAKVIAKALNAQFDILFSEKIFAPNNEDCEIAVVTELKEVLIHEELVSSFNIDLDSIYLKSKYIFDTKMRDNIIGFRDGKKLQSLAGKNVLIIDEDINVGLVMMACIKTIINQRVKSISVATPILSSASIQAIDSITDDLYYIKSIEHYIEAYHYYEELCDLEIEDIKRIKKEG